MSWGDQECSLDPSTVVPIVVCILIRPGNDALFYSIRSILCALELGLGVLKFDPCERRDPLKFLIIKNVFLGIFLGCPPLYPDNNKQMLTKREKITKDGTRQAREEIKPAI